MIEDLIKEVSEEILKKIPETEFLQKLQEEFPKKFPQKIPKDFLNKYMYCRRHFQTEIPAKADSEEIAKLISGAIS